MTKASSRVILGIREGLGLAVWYAAVALILVIARGPELLQSYSLSLFELIGFYVIGGVLSGAIAGVLLPMARRRIGAAIVGFLAMLPTCLVGTLLIIPPVEWEQMVPLVPLVSAALLGIPGGIMWWDHEFNRTG